MHDNIHITLRTKKASCITLMLCANHDLCWASLLQNLKQILHHLCTNFAHRLYSMRVYGSQGRDINKTRSNTPLKLLPWNCLPQCEDNFQWNGELYFHPWTKQVQISHLVPNKNHLQNVTYVGSLNVKELEGRALFSSSILCIHAKIEQIHQVYNNAPSG